MKFRKTKKFNTVESYASCLCAHSTCSCTCNCICACVEGSLPSDNISNYTLGEIGSNTYNVNHINSLSSQNLQA